MYMRYKWPKTRVAVVTPTAPAPIYAYQADLLFKHAYVLSCDDRIIGLQPADKKTLLYLNSDIGRLENQNGLQYRGERESEKSTGYVVFVLPIWRGGRFM